MKKILTTLSKLAILSGFAFFSVAHAQSDCKVLIETIAGEYTGACKKGLANGQGKAVGTDTYEGEFKKGYPNGAGTYTWANGDVFKGEFKKGKKSGAGEKTFAGGGPAQKGYWLEDEYIGTEKTPYKVTNKTVSIKRVSFKRTAAEPHQLDVKFIRLGKPIKAQNYNIQGAFGMITSRSDYNVVIRVDNFPMQGNLSFAAMTARNVSGGGAGGYTDGNFEFKINQPGSWEITVEMQATE